MALLADERMVERCRSQFVRRPDFATEVLVQLDGGHELYPSAECQHGTVKMLAGKVDETWIVRLFFSDPRDAMLYKLSFS